MPARSSLLPICFFVCLSVWTVALLIPTKETANRVFKDDSAKFYISKTLHVCAYAFLTTLSSMAAGNNRQRWYALGLLSFHGFATEFLQQFVHRGASLRDVGLDHIGIVLGFLASRRRWRPEPTLSTKAKG